MSDGQRLKEDLGERLTSRHYVRTRGRNADVSVMTTWQDLQGGMGQINAEEVELKAATW